MDRFDINYKGQLLNVQVVDINGQRIYRIQLPSSGPLLMTRAKNADGVYFWTSVPEGKQKLAEEIGSLIEPLLKSQ
ncbi:MAG TPA: hypothetical protein VEV87_05390 [Chitinophagaceae bacterium]|nr:hypothetical protein [Chitinophagaceae bacterium]